MTGVGVGLLRGSGVLGRGTLGWRTWTRAEVLGMEVGCGRLAVAWLGGAAVSMISGTKGFGGACPCTRPGTRGPGVLVWPPVSG